MFLPRTSRASHASHASPPSSHDLQSTAVHKIMPTKSLRCKWPGCSPLRFDSPDDLGDHQYIHLRDLLNTAKCKSIFRCEWYGCRSQKSGKIFQDLTALKRHARGHVKNHCCSFDGCNLAFSRDSDLARHVQTKHSEDCRYRCPIETCDRSSNGFPRKDKLDEHTRKKHENFRCPIDHCGSEVLECEKEAHVDRFHSGKDSRERGRIDGLFDGIFECALPGCESTTSKFTVETARGHLKTQHGVYNHSCITISSNAKLSGPSTSRGNSFVLQPPDNIFHRPCKSCTKNNAL